MALHGLASVTIGVPEVEETRAYYTEFGLTSAAVGHNAPGRVERVDGVLRTAPVRPPPPSFLHPDDLAELMIGNHSGH